MVTITIPKKVERAVEEISGKLGISKEDFFINALLYYLQTLEKAVELKKELEPGRKLAMKNSQSLKEPYEDQKVVGFALSIQLLALAVNNMAKDQQL